MKQVTARELKALDAAAWVLSAKIEGAMLARLVATIRHLRAVIRRQRDQLAAARPAPCDCGECEECTRPKRKKWNIPPGPA